MVDVARGNRLANQIQSLLSQGKYPAAYTYIGNLINLDPSLSTAGRALVGWFYSAATINKLQPSFLKDFIWTSNTKASVASGGTVLTDAQNQAISDALAQKALGDIIADLRSGKQINAQDTFSDDVGSAVNDIRKYNGNKAVDGSLWAGSILGLA
jgi:hypothetical protein